MADATQMISGLASSIDWRSMVDQLVALDGQSITSIQSKQKLLNAEKSAWQDLNTRLATLKTAVESLADPDTFEKYVSSLGSSSSTSASDLLSLTLGTGVSVGSFDVEIQQLAQSEKLNSASFSSNSDALGLSGDFLLGGKLISVDTTDSLSTLANRINLANSGSSPSGVSASIMSSGTDSYRLVLTATSSGADGISIQDTSTTDIVQSLGFTDTGTEIKHTTSSGAQSDTFSGTDTAVSTLLGLSSVPSGSVTIGAYAGITIDLSQSLTQIRDSINSQAGSTIASIVEETDGDTTEYRLKLIGTSFTDDSNVLETLGILSGTHGSVAEVIQGSALSKTTAAGGGVISAATTFGQINTGSDANNVTNGDTITITGKDHAGNTISGTFTITDTATTTVGDLLTEIESLYTAAGNSVTASVDGNGKITITDDTTGDSQLTLSLVANNEGGGTLDFGTIETTTDGRSMQIQAGRNSIVEIDGMRVERSSNVISDVVGGASLTLKAAEVGTTITATINRDTAGIRNEVEGFIIDFNSVMAYIQAQTSYDAETQETGGPLFGDATLSTLQSQLLSQTIGTISDANSNLNTLSLAGITLKDNGGLQLDSSKFEGLLETNFADVVTLFAAQGSGSVSTLQYLAKTSDTQSGSYAINITQAAEKAAITGTTDLSGGLASDETLTITDKMSGQVAVVSLTAGMTDADVAAAINTELEKNYFQTLTEATGHNTLSSQGGGAIAINTTWEKIDTTGGDSNDITNGDVITFTGTSRSGGTISGSYTIEDKANSTIGDLLEVIQDEFGDSVDVSLDTNGSIVVTDLVSGMSNVSLSVNYTGSGSLSFDTMNESTSGRYAMEISASTDGSGHLILNSDLYGSAAGFTISQSVNNLGITDQEYTGLDVEGTIDGRTATGSGQTLYLNDDGADADGLRLMYTGTSTGAIGNLTLTLGFSEVLDRILEGYTDNYSGYISAKSDGIDESVKSMDNQIERLEIRINLKRERMYTQFIAMEKMIGSLQTQQTWLSAQLAKI